MSSEQDLFVGLPEPPSPSAKAREAAIERALSRFEAKHQANSQGLRRPLRLMAKKASLILPSPGRFAMPRARHLVAASVVLLIAGSVVWLNDRSPQFTNHQVDSTNTRLAPGAQPARPITVSPPSGGSLPPPAGLSQSPRSSREFSMEQGRGVQARAARDQGAQFDALTRPRAVEIAPPAEPTGRDKFAGAQENGFKIARETPVSIFSIDVDTASYSFTRASLNRNVVPQPAAVRTEEFINYFPYDYAAPTTAAAPFRTTVAVFPNPWSEGRKIIQIGIKGYAVQPDTRPRANLVFLIDTSGSMNAPNRLPLVKQSLALLLTQLDRNDRVAIVTYAGRAGTALEPTAASDKAKILGVIERLEASGSTAGAEGIRQAYALADQNFDPNGVKDRKSVV